MQVASIGEKEPTGREEHRPYQQIKHEQKRWLPAK